MTDEEIADVQLAEAWVGENGFCSDCNNINSVEANIEMVNAFLAGLKADRSKWHKVADGDLPKEEAEYLVIFESDGTRYIGVESYYPDTKEWSTICKIIAWLGIPKFEEVEGA